MDENILSRNSLSLIAMANEYCHEIEAALDKEREDFVTTMLKLLPRIYIVIRDVVEKEDTEDLLFIDSYLYEDAYNNAREKVYRLLGEDDVYLEVFEEDMKYSDTPIATTVSENLADIYQELYNFVMTLQNAPTEVAGDVIYALKDSFKSYWGQTLVNVMRALHNLSYNEPDFD